MLNRPFLLCACMAMLSPARAGTPERDKAWDALIAQAQSHGGQETKLDQSVSYVFQRPDGSYLTFTRLTGADKRRSVCLISEGETATACIDWDSGKLTLGDRADAATPWRFRTLASLDAFEAAQPTIAERLFSALNGLLPGSGKGKRGGNGYYRLSRNGNWYWSPNP